MTVSFGTVSNARSVAETMPQPEQPGMQGQSVAAEAFRVAGLADFQYAEDISFEMSPTELADAFVVLQVSGTAVAAENAGVYFAQ